MAKRQKKQNDKCLTVIVRHVAAPDAKQRLSRAVNILLKVAAKSTTAEEEKLSRHTRREEGLTRARDEIGDITDYSQYENSARLSFGKLSEVVKGQQNV